MSEPGGRHPPPFYCPYCGEERIRPVGEHAGEWACELCRRTWRLHHLGGVGGEAHTGADRGGATGPDTSAGAPT